MHGERLNEFDRGGRFREDQEPLPFQHEAQQSLPRSVPFADHDTDARNLWGHVSLHIRSLLRPVWSPFTPMPRSSRSRLPMGDQESSFAADADGAFTLGGHRPL